MWVITHLIAGMAIGAVVPGPLWVAVVAAVASHLVLDLIPHWDYTGTPRRLPCAILDVGAAAFVSVFAWRYLGVSGRVLLCGLASAFPDLDVLTGLALGDRRKRWFPSHWRGFPHGKAGPYWGIIVQAALVAVSVALVARG